MKIKTTEGERFGLLTSIILMEYLIEKKILTEKEMRFILDTAVLALEKDKFQYDMK